MITLFVVVFSLVSVIGLCALAVISDVKGLRIANIISLLVALAFFVCFAWTWVTGVHNVMFAPLPMHLLPALMMFAVTLVLFALRLFGAGDAKLITALSLWVPGQSLAVFLFWTTVAGGGLGLVAWAIRKFAPVYDSGDKTGGGEDGIASRPGWIGGLRKGQNAIPYGVAIFPGMLASFYHAGYFSPGLLVAIFERAPF